MTDTIQTAPDQHEHPTVVIDERAPARTKTWLDHQSWHAEPLESIPQLVAYARDAEWAASSSARTRRLIWLYAVAAPARVAPWLVLRAWKGARAPGFSGELPSIREATDVDGAKNRIAAAAYSTASISARIAESAPRVGVTALIAWCGVNAAGWPEIVTASYWWGQISALWANTTSATHAADHAAPTANQIASGVVQLLLVAAVAAYLVVKRRNKTNRNGRE